jgi:hypothetical protein
MCAPQKNDGRYSTKSIERKSTGVLDPATGASGMYWSWNAGPTNISIAENPYSHSGAYSKTVANNYADMFIIDHVHNH